MVFFLAVAGRDRPGIVAELSRVLFESGLNIEDSRMAIMHGHFAVALVVTGDPGDEVQLRADLESVRDRLALDTVTLSAIEGGSTPAALPTHIVTVYGADHPGIVHSVSSVLAQLEINITDLTTRLLGEDDQLYVMLLEVALPGGLDPMTVEQRLQQVHTSQRVDVTVRQLDSDRL